MPELVLATPYGHPDRPRCHGGGDLSLPCFRRDLHEPDRDWPRLARALRALPGSIVIATILPIAAQAGSPAFLGIATAIGAMIATRMEVAAIAAGARRHRARPRTGSVEPARNGAPGAATPGQPRCHRSINASARPGGRQVRVVVFRYHPRADHHPLRYRHRPPHRLRPRWAVA